MNHKDTVNAARRSILKGMGLAALTSLTSLIPKVGRAASDGPASQPARDVPFRGVIPETVPKGYNILLITCDQERFFDQYPCPVPGRDRLMKTGVTFGNHQITANVCTPSRSVMYTGLHMPQTRMFDNLGFPWMNYDLDPKLRTVGHMMRELGYYSVYKGKWHLCHELDHPIKDMSDEGINKGSIPTPRLNSIMEGYGFSDYYGIGDIIGTSKGGYFFDPVTAAQSISWLRNTGQPLTEKGKPWFMAVNLVNPHDVMFINTDEPGEKVQWKKAADNDKHSLRPTQPPHNRIYQRHWSEYPLPENRHQPLDEPGRPAAHKEYQEARALLEGQFPDEDRRWRKLLDYYFNCIRDSDQHVEALLNELDNLGLTEKTIVVFTADHGELGGAHQMHGKGSSVYREQIHVPMIIRHPAYPGNVRCDSLTCHLDLVPTLIGLTGCDRDMRSKVLAGRKGRDMSALLAQPAKSSVHALRDASLYCFGMILYADKTFTQQYGKLAFGGLPQDVFQREMGKIHPDFRHRSAIRMINDGKYKFARYFSLKQHNMPESIEELVTMNDIELFDLEADPQENVNLAHNPEKYRDILLTMNRKLNQLIKEELGQDDGSYLPELAGAAWNLSAEQFQKALWD